MLMEFVCYLFYFLAAVGILFGVVSLSVLVFYGRNQTRCRSVVLLQPEDRDAEWILRACLRADRLLSRGEPALIIDCGLPEETRRVVERMSADARAILVQADASEELLSAIFTPPA